MPEEGLRTTAVQSPDQRPRASMVTTLNDTDQDEGQETLSSVSSEDTTDADGDSSGNTDAEQGRETECSSSPSTTFALSDSQCSKESAAAEEVSTCPETMGEKGTVAGGRVVEQEQRQHSSSFRVGSRRRSAGSVLRRKAARDGDDDSQSSCDSSYVTLSPEEKEWILVSATADYQAMFRLLVKNGNHLANVKNISNYTALHWAAKFGKPEVVKMLANKIGVNVNQRSGFTPLHLAAMHGHNDIIELLISVYNADPNIRDYSGKKPRQYQQNTLGRGQHYFTYNTATDWDVIFTPGLDYRLPRGSRSGSIMHECSTVEEVSLDDWVLVDCDDEFDAPF